MFTIFTICAPFKEKGLLQRNAIKSWLNLEPKPEIFIMGGKEQGIKEIAEEFDLKVLECEVNEDGVPLTNSMFQTAQKHAKNDILCFINSDILLYQNFIEGIYLIKKQQFKEYVAVGQRHDVNVDYEVTSEMLENFYTIASKGKMHGDGATDYFIFPKTFDWSHMPPFDSVRIAWDTWICLDTKKRKLPLIDCTNIIKIVHQNHERPWAKDMNVIGSENQKKNNMNVFLAGKDYHDAKYKGLKKEATHVLTKLHISDKIIKTREFFKDAWAYQDIKNMVKLEQPIIVDGGACVGDTVDIFKQAYPKSTIYAFEAVMGQMVKGRSLNDISVGHKAINWTNIRVIPFALGEKNKLSTVYITDNPENSSLLKPITKKIFKTDKVIILSLDEWTKAEGITKIDIVKLDIQGNELNALKGMEHFLITTIKAILLEVNFQKQYENVPTFYDIGEYLNRYGFKLFQVYEPSYKQVNALFIKDI